MYYTYIDWTNDNKPFYVGMGLNNRIVRLFNRNKKHTHVAKKHGLRREIVGEFKTREDAIALEIQLIQEHHTFVDDPLYNGIGCNYTTGGEGCPCSEEIRRKISETIKNSFKSGERIGWNKGLSYKQNISDKTREKRRQIMTAYNLAHPSPGRKHTEETRQKMKKPHTCSICKLQGHTKTTCPERAPDAVNNVTVAQIKRRRKTH